jgi:SAM-dependent methyltransferase
MIYAPFDAQFWEDKYQSGIVRWDLGQAAPPLVSLLRSPEAPKPGKIAVLGFGTGHDALLFAASGFEVIGFDFAPSAIAAASKTAQAKGLNAQFLQKDIFDLAEFSGQFDYVLEHTCFCAIALHQRPEYVQVVHDLLHPDGEFIGLFWAHARAGGPPFGTTVSEIRTLFAPLFDITNLRPVFNSVQRRANEEYLARFQAK